jgi:hypothetical protein
MAGTPFTPLDILRDPDGVVVPVTYRLREGFVELSYCVQKEFDRDGRADRTAWLKKAHLPAMARLLEKLPPFLDVLEDRVRAELRRTRQGG